MDKVFFLNEIGIISFLKWMEKVFFLNEIGTSVRENEFENTIHKYELLCLY